MLSESIAKPEAPAAEERPVHDVRYDRAGFNGRSRYSCYGLECRQKPSTIVQQPYHRPETWKAAVEQFLSIHETAAEAVRDDGWQA